MQIDRGERVCLIGRNGAGKTTLLRVASGEQPPDAGTRWLQPGVRVARLEQDVPLSTTASVFDVVAEGLGDVSALVTAYHHAIVEVGRDHSPRALARLSEAQHRLDEQDGWNVEQRVETVLAQLVPAGRCAGRHAVGRLAPADAAGRALVAQPDLLLLDEPTNHLDIEAITWLETLLADYPGAVLFITHDRAFLQRLATRIVELDRGRLTSWPGDYETFLRRQRGGRGRRGGPARIRQEARRGGSLASPGHQGTAHPGRRPRESADGHARGARRPPRQAGHVRLQAASAEVSGKLVFEAEASAFGFGGSPVVRDFSCRVMRGDRIGLIGPNGSGKTTLLRLLLGELTPDEGRQRIGANVQVAYYDQQREQLDPERTVADIVGEGNDTVTVNGQSRHIIGYLKDFLFPPERARSPVKALSGGERNRLLLARLFTRPANVLVLDEPTNDLDIETLELLEALLAEWPGTLLLVSHDRVFLDNVVTSTLVFEGDGRVQEFVGGYEDWEAPGGFGGAEAPSGA